MNDVFARVRQDILVEGLDDYECLSTVPWLVGSYRSGLEPEGVRPLSLLVLLELLETRMITMGFGLDEHHVPIVWHHTPTRIIARFSGEWDALGREPTLEEIAWIWNTPLGDAEAERLLASEGAGHGTTKGRIPGEMRPPRV